jgi:hypothetical protein
MSYVHPAWLEHQRQRWQRHDAHRFVKPEPIQRKTYTERLLEQRREAEEQAAFEAERAALERGLLEVRRELAGLKLDLAIRRLRLKANFNPDQPRVPKGDPKGGQWAKEGSGDAGKESGDESLVTADAALRRGGHHYIPRQVYKDRKALPKETRKVFEEATTGTLSDNTLNVFSTAHRRYNKAVNNLFNQFLTKNGIEEAQMTPDHARQLLKEVIASNDPPIRNFNQRIWLREALRGPRFRGRE